MHSSDPQCDHCEHCQKRSTNYPRYKIRLELEHNTGQSLLQGAGFFGRQTDKGEGKGGGWSSGVLCTTLVEGIWGAKARGRGVEGAAYLVKGENGNRGKSKKTSEKRTVGTSSRGVKGGGTGQRLLNSG